MYIRLTLERKATRPLARHNASTCRQTYEFARYCHNTSWQMTIACGCTIGMMNDEVVLLNVTGDEVVLLGVPDERVLQMNPDGLYDSRR